MAELTKKIHDRYWKVKEMGDVKRMEAFISMLDTSINPIISQLKINKSINTSIVKHNK
jgi:hypothetical protein